MDWLLQCIRTCVYTLTFRACVFAVHGPLGPPPGGCRQLHGADGRHARHGVAQVHRAHAADLRAPALLCLQRHLARGHHLLPAACLLLRRSLCHGHLQHADVLQVCVCVTCYVQFVLRFVIGRSHLRNSLAHCLFSDVESHKKICVCPLVSLCFIVVLFLIFSIK